MVINIYLYAIVNSVAQAAFFSGMFSLTINDGLSCKVNADCNLNLRALDLFYRYSQLMHLVQWTSYSFWHNFMSEHSSMQLSEKLRFCFGIVTLLIFCWNSIQRFVYSYGIRTYTTIHRWHGTYRFEIIDGGQAVSVRRVFSL